MSEELTGLLVASVIDSAAWLVFRLLRSKSEADLALLRACQTVREGQSARELLRGAGELPRVALSGTLAPHSSEEIVSRDGQRCIAFMETHAQVSSDGTVRRSLFSEKRIPNLVAVRKLSSWSLGVTGPTEERINLRNPASANGFDRLFRVRRDHRVPLAGGFSTDLFHIQEKVIPAGLVLNFMGSLSYDPISRQLHMKLLEVGFTDMAELIDSASFSASVFRFLSRLCLFTTLVLLGFTARSAYRLYQRHRGGSGGGSRPPSHPRPAPVPSGDASGPAASSSPPASGSNPCGVCLDRAPNTALVDCGHTMCAVCAAAVDKCPFCSKPKTQHPVRLYTP